jgi:type I restriction enzyme S subunit
MSVDMNVPDIRFKGFSGEWVSFPLDGISDVLDGDRGHNYPNGDDLKNQGHTLFLSASNVTKNGFKFDTRQYITQDKSDSLGNGKLIPDDIILTSRGSIGHVAWYNENVNRAVPFARINSGMLILRAKSHIAPSVISQYLKSPMGKKKIEGISFGSAQPQLTKASVSKYLVSIPSEKPEQTQIGNTFQKLDSLINQHQQKHDKLSSVKKAMLEKMFPKQGETTPEIRFKGFSGEWAEKELGELAEIVRGASPRPIEDPKWFDNQSSVGWLRIRDVTEQDGRIHHLVQRISKLGQEKTRVLHEKHLLLSIAASVGKPVVNYIETGVHDGFLIFQKPLFELEFMYQWLKSFELKWQQYGQPGSQVNLNSDIVKRQFVAIPSNEEQQEIGIYFQKLDRLINQHQQQITKLNNIKQACLSKMFV